jgi:hypothetical protein
MITTMTPVRAIPSSTRLTPTFTPPNTKSIAPKGAPALQQRQGFDNGTLKHLGKETDSLLHFLRLYIDHSRPYEPSELFERVNKLEEKVVVIIATIERRLTPSDSLLQNLGLKRLYKSFMKDLGQQTTAEVVRRLPGQIESYQQLLNRIQSAKILILDTKKLKSNPDITPNDSKRLWTELRNSLNEQVRPESSFRSFIRVMFGR